MVGGVGGIRSRRRRSRRSRRNMEEKKEVMVTRNLLLGFIAASVAANTDTSGSIWIFLCQQNKGAKQRGTSTVIVRSNVSIATVFLQL